MLGGVQALRCVQNRQVYGLADEQMAMQLTFSEMSVHNDGSVLAVATPWRALSASVCRPQGLGIETSHEAVLWCDVR